MFSLPSRLGVSLSSSFSSSALDFPLSSLFEDVGSAFIGMGGGNAGQAPAFFCKKNKKQ